MNTNLPLRPQMNDRLQIALPSEQKQRAFEVAARKGMSVGQLVRSALDTVTRNSETMQERQNG